MRIRSIRPEFWSSEDVAEMDWHTRLVYIGLWSYVDDNGVGRDKERLITAALFPLDDDLRESSRRVTGALRHLSDHGQITRYTVDDKPFLHIAAWNTHQRIEKASKGRYPLPTCEDAEITEPSRNTPGALQEMSALGEGEKGRRGEESLSPDESGQTDDRFDEFWDTYSKKVGRKKAEQKWRLALKKPGITADLLISSAASYVKWQRSEGKHPEFTKDPATWLNGEHWTDERPSGVVAPAPRYPHATELEAPPDGLSDDEYAEWLWRQQQRRLA